MSFSTLGLLPVFQGELENQGFKQAYPIQQKVIPAVLAKKDVLGIAKTGSGKTASYVLPVLTNLHGNIETSNRHVNVLVLVPTRELATQVSEVFNSFGKVLPNRIKTLAVFGGVSINPQMIALQGVNVLIATPGRLLELIDSNAVHLSEVDTFILDEADKMLNLGFKKEVDRIISLLPIKRQNLLFSATLNDDVDGVNRILLRSPLIVKIDDQEDNIELINQTAFFVADERKGPLLRYIIKQNDIKQVLVFASSIYKADNVADKLRKNGIEAAAIHGKKSQKARNESLRNFKQGNLRVLVTTDLLARGIDIEQLPYVINYELPRSPKDYIHRIGRTGRAEARGNAISLITPNEEHHFKIIQKKMGKKVEMLESKDLELKGY